METNSAEYGTQWLEEIKGLKAAWQRTTNGKPQIVVECEVLEGQFKGAKVQYRGLMNPENVDQTKRTIQSMTTLGCVDFKHDPFGPNALKGMGKIARGVLAKEPDQNGVERLVVKFINENSLVRPESQATSDDQAKWRAQFSGIVNEIKETEKAKAAAKSGDEDSTEPNF